MNRPNHLPALLPAALAALLAAPLTAQNWKMDLEVAEGAFQELFDRRLDEGYMPAAVTARAAGTGTNFQVTWKTSSGAWEMRHGDDGASLTTAATNYTTTGYRPAFVESYGDPSDERYASLWVHEPGLGWETRGQLTAAQLQSEHATQTGLGRTLHWISANGSGPGTRFAAVWLQSGATGAATFATDEAGFDAFLANHPTRHLVSMSTFGANDSMFCGVVHDAPTTPQTYRDRTAYEIDLDAFQQAQLGYATTLVHARVESGDVRFTTSKLFDSATDVWRVTGAAVPGMSGFDTVMQDYMQTNGIAQGSLAVVKNGRLQVARGYTWGPMTYPDATETTTYRIASVSKPLTSIAIMKLLQEGAFAPLGLDTPVSDILSLASWAAVDAQVDSITLRDLLHHRGGFDSSTDPMFNDISIDAAVGDGLPVDKDDIIAWMSLQALADAPGSNYVYSNFGFSLLGRVIEQVSGLSYEDYMYDEVLGPLGAGTMQIGGSLFDERSPRESLSGDLLATTSSNAMGTGPATVPTQYGRWNFGNLDSHGGWVASAIDVARVIAQATNPGVLLSPPALNEMWQPHPNESATTNSPYVKGWWATPVASGTRYNHNGALTTGTSDAGCRAFLARRTDGVVWMACFGGFASPGVDASLGAQADATTWSPLDLFDDYASVRTSGDGCPGPEGLLRLRPASDAPPTVDSSFSVVLENLGLSPINIPLMVLSVSQPPFAVPLDAIGMTGCFLHVDLEALETLTNLGGTATYTLPIPDEPFLVGIDVHMQGAELSPGANPAGLITSHALTAAIGN